MTMFRLITAGALASLSSAGAAQTGLNELISKTFQSTTEIKKGLDKLPADTRVQYLAALRFDPRIVGGDPVAITAHPWQVALIRGEPGGRYQFCGGSLVAPDTVLTAAHCIDSTIVKNDPARVDIVAGATFFAEGGERIKVKAVYTHPQWNRTTMDYDVAVIKLVSSSTKGTPIAIEAAPTPPAEVWVTGWGALSDGGPSSPELMGAKLPLVDRSTCNAQDSYNGEITERMLCAGLRDGGLDSCQGDSGGPLTSGEGASARLIGVVSWGEGCARKLKYGVYTNLTTTRAWVETLVAPQTAASASGTMREGGF